MQREQALERLAMGISEWPTLAHVKYMAHGHYFYMHDWEKKRIELINKPDWDDLPDWAEWLMQHRSGEWYAFKEKPMMHAEEWYEMENSFLSYGKIPAGHRWQDTLEQRPAQHTKADEELAACVARSRSDGSTASYYELPKGAAELQELISHRDMNAQIGEIFRAAYRYGMASHSDQMRDAKKIRFYIDAEIKRLEKLV